jgi:hypothetical protein
MEAPAKMTLVTESGREGDVRQAAVCLQQQLLGSGDSTSDHEFVWWHPNGAMKRPRKVGCGKPRLHRESLGVERFAKMRIDILLNVTDQSRWQAAEARALRRKWSIGQCIEPGTAVW